MRSFLQAHQGPHYFESGRHWFVKPCYWLPLVSWTIYSFDSFCVGILVSLGKAKKTPWYVLGRNGTFLFFFWSIYIHSWLLFLGRVDFKNSNKTFIHVLFFSLSRPEKQHPQPHTCNENPNAAAHGGFSRLMVTVNQDNCWIAGFDCIFSPYSFAWLN